MKVLQVMVLCLCLRSMSGVAAWKLCACVREKTEFITGTDNRFVMPGVCFAIIYPYFTRSIWIRLLKDGKTMYGPRKCFQIKRCQTCPRIITRQEWKARPAKSTTHLSTPVKYAVVHHSDTPGCSTKSSCIARIQSIQNYHMNKKNWTDIGYNFLIGGDGNVYEGRGWNNVGAHTKGYNSRSIGICVIGTYNILPPKTNSLNALRRLLACLQNKNKLKNDYLLRGHRDLGHTDCPGQKLYNIIKTWPHYK